MSVELSLSGKRIFLLSLGLLVAGALLFVTGMLVEAGRLHPNAGRTTARSLLKEGADTTAARAVPCLPPTALPAASSSLTGARRLRPSLTPSRPHRLTPIPVLDHPPAPIASLRGPPSVVRDCES